MSRATIRHELTTAGEIERINPRNKELIESFLREKDIHSSSGTIIAYKSDLQIFFVYVLNNLDNKFFVDIKKLEFAEFFSYCTNRLGWSSCRFNRMRACLSSLSNFIEKYMDEEFPLFRNNIIKLIDSMPDNKVREKTILTEQQINILLSTVSKQEACFISLAISSGARLSELLRFTTDLIDVNNLVYSGLFIETSKMIKTKGRTKQGELKYKYIIKDLFLPYYDIWLVERERILKENNQTHTSIFIKQDGTPATISIIRNWLPRWEEITGVPVYPHCFRHYAVTFLTRVGLSSELIVELLGWKSPNMYKIYNDLNSKDREWKELDKLKQYFAIK
jgi:integrase